MGSTMSADTGEVILVVIGLVSILIMVAGSIRRRREKVQPLVYLGMLPALLLVTGWAHWDEWEVLALFALEAGAAGAIGYGVLRSGLFRMSPIGACIGGIATAAVLPLLLALGVLNEHGATWMLVPLPLSLLVGSLVGLVGLVLRRLTGGLTLAAPLGSGDTPASGGQDRAAVLNMLAEGSISADEATALLDAMGADRRPGDRRPLSGGTIGGLLGGLIVVVGFMLPWGHVQIGAMTGYQAGYHVGFLGWLILLLGTVPAVLACIPALDRHVRQGMLLLLFGTVGVVFALPLVIKASGVGLFVVLAGFGFQIVGGAVAAGILVRRRGAPSDGRP